MIELDFCDYLSKTLGNIKIKGICEIDQSGNTKAHYIFFKDQQGLFGDCLCAEDSENIDRLVNECINDFNSTQERLFND